MVHTRLLPAVLLALCASGAHGQVFKCLDTSGNVTYQQGPCTAGSRGAAVELRTDNAQSQDAADRDGRWRVAADQGTVVAGMPKRWVQQALGQPREIRRGTLAEGVPEVWVYQTPRGPMRVGFRSDAVEWSRVDSTGAGPGAAAAPPRDAGSVPAGSLPGGSTPAGSMPAGSLPAGSTPAGSMPAASIPSARTPAASTPSGAAPAGSPGGSNPGGIAPGGISALPPPTGPSAAGETARSRVTADRRCDEVLAELGPAARREPLQASGERPVEAVRYAYEPLPGGLPVRLSFTCIDGRIASVSRDIAH